MRFRQEEIEAIIEIADIDGAWSLFKGMGLQEECDYIEDNYYER